MHPPPSPRSFVARLAALLCLLLPACADGVTGRADVASPKSSPGSAAPPLAGTPDPAAATADPHERMVDAALEDMDLRDRVAQLFVAGVPLQDLAAGDELVRDHGVGGVFLAGRSSIPATELAEVTARWRDLAAGPEPWIAVDQEGGAVQTLRGEGFADLPSAVDQGQLPPGELAALAGDLGAALADAGITLDLAPVADIVPAGTEAGNAPIGAHERQYGGTAEQVVAAAGTVVDGLAEQGVTATLKHFPGLGRVRGNTDTTRAVTDTVTTPDDAQVAAFATLAEADGDGPAPFVMTSSATYTRIDPAEPAAFSEVVVTDLLREQLGFDGVVISDDLGNAAAVADVPVGERAVRFLEAGGTLVLTVNPATVQPMIEAVLARAEADPAFAAAVDAAARTALEAKAGAGLLTR